MVDFLFSVRGFILFSVRVCNLCSARLIIARSAIVDLFQSSSILWCVVQYCLYRLLDGTEVRGSIESIHMPRIIVNRMRCDPDGCVRRFARSSRGGESSTLTVD